MQHSKQSCTGRSNEMKTHDDWFHITGMLDIQDFPLCLPLYIRDSSAHRGCKVRKIADLTNSASRKYRSRRNREKTKVPHSSARPSPRSLFDCTLPRAALCPHSNSGTPCPDSL